MQAGILMFLEQHPQCKLIEVAYASVGKLDDGRGYLTAKRKRRIHKARTNEN